MKQKIDLNRVIDRLLCENIMKLSIYKSTFVRFFLYN